MFERERGSHKHTQENIDQLGHETVWSCMYIPKYTKKDFQRNPSLSNIPLVSPSLKQITSQQAAPE